MLSAAFAMLVCGCLSVFQPPVELALHRRHVDDVRVARRHGREHSGRKRALSTNGATALTRWTSSSSAVGTSASVIRQRVAVAQVDLLQILVELALADRDRPPRSRSSASSGTCESTRRLPQAGRARSRAVAISPAPSAARAQRAIALEHGALERSRAGSCSPSTTWSYQPDGRRTVWHALLMMASSRGCVASRWRAERLDARRVPQVDAVDVQAVDPVVAVGLAAKRARRVARKSRRDDHVARRRAAA